MLSFRHHNPPNCLYTIERLLHLTREVQHLKEKTIASILPERVNTLWYLKIVHRDGEFTFFYRNIETSCDTEILLKTNNIYLDHYNAPDVRRFLYNLSKGEYLSERDGIVIDPISIIEDEVNMYGIE